MLDGISGFVVYCDCGCSVFGPELVDVLDGFVVFLVYCDCFVFGP